MNFTSYSMKKLYEFTPVRKKKLRSELTHTEKCDLNKYKITTRNYNLIAFHTCSLDIFVALASLSFCSLEG